MSLRIYGMITGDKEALKETLAVTGVRHIGGKGPNSPQSKDLPPEQLPWDCKPMFL